MKDQTWRQHFRSLERSVTTRDLMLAVEIILTAIEDSKLEIMASIDDVVQAVTDESTVVDSVVTLLTNVEQQLKDALNSNQVPPDVAAKLNKVATMIAANKQKLADAVVANTPAAGDGGQTTDTDTSTGGGDTNTDTDSGTPSDSGAGQ